MIRFPFPFPAGAVLPAQAVPLVRLATGLLQGLGLYWLYRASAAKTWPATDPSAFGPLVMALVFAPVLAVSGAGSVRLGTLTLWTFAAAGIGAGLAAHDIFVHAGAANADISPSAPAWSAVFAMLYILHALIVAGDRERRAVATYPRLFDASWKHGLQLLLALLFTAVFWVLLYLGDALFRLIKIEAVHNVITEEWFFIPVTAMLFAAALHVTDVQAAMIEGTRTLILRLFAWLLPVFVLLTGAFVLVLPFAGIGAFVATDRGLDLPLEAAFALVFLMNTVYQDGEPERRANPVLGTATLAAIPLLGLLALIEAYALVVRVGQSGWLPERVFALAGLAVIACYAAGYGAAAVRSGLALQGFGLTNVVTALVTVGLGLALFTPLADPARISARDQVRRLTNGAAAPEAFDFMVLRFGTGRYGREALEDLAKRSGEARTEQIAALAQKALSLSHRWGRMEDAGPATPESRRQNIAVLHPAGVAVPESFLRQAWTADGQAAGPDCLLTRRGSCEAVLADLDGDGTTEVLLFAANVSGVAFQSGKDGAWRRIGTLYVACPSLPKPGPADFETSVPAFRDIAVKGRLYSLRRCD